MSERECTLGILSITVSCDRQDDAAFDADCHTFDQINWQALVSGALEAAGLDITKIDVHVSEG